MAWKVLISSRLFDATPEAIEVLERAGCQITITNPNGRAWEKSVIGDRLVDVLKDFDAFICGAPELDRAVLTRLPNLKLIARRGVGYDSIDVEAAREFGKMVTITAGANHEAVADHVFALLLAAARQVCEGNQEVREGRWAPGMGVGLPRKTLGIVGLGRIGKSVALRAAGFSMTILATDPVRDEAFAGKHNIRYVELPELLANSHFVTLNATLNDTTHHIINATTLRMMKPSAILVNTARGPLIDESALVQALEQKIIRAAGIDVFETEPASDSKLLGAPNAVLTPHAAGSTEEAYYLMNVKAAETVVLVMRGERPDEESIVVAPRVYAAG